MAHLPLAPRERGEVAEGICAPLEFRASGVRQATPLLSANILVYELALDDIYDQAEIEVESN